MSVGYDLAGIRSARVRGFLDGLMDATRGRRPAAGDRFPAPVAQFRDLPFPTRISDTLTLSTFHGCPPERDRGDRRASSSARSGSTSWSSSIRPCSAARRSTAILHDALGYRELNVPDRAFDKDATWEQVAGFVDRLGACARARGRGFGVKFSNTLVVENHKSFFPASEKVMYLSGPPLHVLAMRWSRRFRRAFGDRFPDLVLRRHRRRQFRRRGRARASSR